MKVLKTILGYAANALLWICIGVPTAVMVLFGIVVGLARGYSWREIREILTSKY